MSTSEKIAKAYGVLVARGDKITVRAVQRQAGVRIGEVAAWMREHATGSDGDVPETPDFSEAMSAMASSVWAVAWTRAAEQADEQVAEALDAARTGEAEALAAVEQAITDKDEAVVARDEAVKDAERLRREVEQLHSDLERSRQQAALDSARAEEADRARVRAESASDTLREILDTFRNSTEQSDS